MQGFPEQRPAAHLWPWFRAELFWNEALLLEDINCMKQVVWKLISFWKLRHYFFKVEHFVIPLPVDVSDNSLPKDGVDIGMVSPKNNLASTVFQNHLDHIIW